ncbi:Dual specificity protein phosphatase 23 [Blattella germanica]|nr:Dual specificity protein phosphatase 23 [Blattella germanica]
MEYDMDREIPPWNFSWIVKDELAGMGWPQTLENFKFLEQQGIKHLVTLSPEKRPPARAFPEINWIEIPIEEFCAPTLKQMKDFIDLCKTCRSKQEPVGIHCRMGRGRTGVMAACYLVYFCDQHPDQAITKIRIMRPGSVETYEQEKAVKEFNDYLRSI